MTTKTILIAALLFGISTATLAQAKVEIGLKGGLNVANINTESVGANYESATGYHFGAFAQLKVLMIGIQPEVLYSTRGTNVTLSSTGQDFKQEFVYLDVPVMFKFFLPLGVNLQAGPQFGVLVSASGEIADPNNSNSTVKISKDSYKDADTSAVLGVGWDAPFGLKFSARYIIGLSDMRDDQDSKNRMFQLSAGFRLFKIGS